MIISNKILDQFDSVSLKEMDTVKLMNRTDIKFTFPLCRFNEILGTIINDYRILEIKGKRISSYKTLYYDTENLSLYNKHHNGEMNRYKIRSRTYVETGNRFLEVKFKSNKGRTIKNRIELLSNPLISDDTNETFLTDLLPFDPNTLHPSIWVNYDRLTLVNKVSSERVTIDIRIEFINGSVNNEFNNLVIAEVKQGRRIKSPFLNAMKKFRIREESISKYCIGIALTHDNVKKNNFKEKINRIKQLLDESVTNNK